jgi:hypothetical protein
METVRTAATRTSSRFGQSRWRPIIRRHHVACVRDWLLVAWVLWWSWSYIHSALGHRFPQLMPWIRYLW